MFEEFKVKEVKKPKAPVSTILDTNLWDFAIQNNIRWVDALDLGVRMLLKEAGVFEDWPECTLKKEKERLAQSFIDLNEELLNLQERLKDESRS